MKKVWLWIRILISLGLIVFLLYTVDFGDMSGSLAGSNIYYLIAALLVAFGDRFLMAYKWNILLKAKSIHIPLLRVTAIYLISSFLGLFLPATVGGDAIRAYAVAKGGQKGRDIVSSIVVERLFGILALLIFVLISITLSIFVFGQSFFASIWSLFGVILLVFLFFSAFIYLSLNRSLLQRLYLLIAGRNTKINENKWVDKLKGIYQSYLAYQEHKKELGVFLLWSFLENLFPIFWTYFLALAFNIPVPLLYLFILEPIVLVLVRLPISIDGIGIKEGAFVYFLTLIGIPSSDALLLGIASHVLGVISILPGGVLYGLNGLGVRRNMSKQGVNLSVSADAKDMHGKEENLA
jgi:glycosyltransferase 2 family protein